MKDDRISEPLKDEVWAAAKRSTQRRIQWLCSQAEGDAVLDIGCSQGIASILLGREGFHVTGIDIQPSRIEDARVDLELEPGHVRDRVTFEVGSGSELHFEDDCFDTVILGEVIEHLAVPNRLFDEVRRVLKPGGVVVITTPFGLSSHRDRKQVFYPSRLWKVISENLLIRSVAVVDEFFRIVAECPSADLPESGSIDAETADMLDDVWSTFDADLRSSRLKAADLEKTNEALRDQVDRQVEEAASLNAELGERTWSLVNSGEETREMRVRSVEREQHIDSQAKKIVYQTEKITSQTDRITKLEGRLSNSVGRITVQKQRISRLEDERAKLRDRLALTRWKLTSMTSRKWWRIGAAIGRVKSNVLRIFVLPFDIVSILFSRSNLPPRPQPTRVKQPIGSKADPP